MNKMMNNKHSITFGSKQIEFHLKRADRKTMSVQVHPDKSVHVIAPIDASLTRIQEKVKSKAAWVLAQLVFFDSFHPLTPLRQYVSGETHLYLGRQYRLKVIEDPTEAVKLLGKYLTVSSGNLSSDETIRKLLENWYREKAMIHFEEVLAKVLPRFSKYDLPSFNIVIRKMEKRWGSCAPSGRITLNLELIKAPKGSIEYVIVHELCHLLHPNHTRKFFDLQGSMMLDWKRWKERLEQMLA
ncbi:MAG: M48 family metallopeptidase [Bacteroidetes bacterium]|nr:M48 family metallopeptidase [Bacteroidota bacterium]